MSTPDPAWRVKRTPCPFYQSGKCIFKHKCNFIHDGDINMRRADIRAQVPVYRRTPENSVDSFSSSEEDEPVQEHQIDEHSAAAPSLIFSSIYGPRPNSINRLQLANVDLPVSPESLPNTPPRTSRPTSHHLAHNHINITSPTPSRPLSSSLGIGIGGRAQGGLAEVFTAIANTQAQAQSTALPPSSAESLLSPLSLSPRSPPNGIQEINGVQEIVIKDEGYSLEQLPFKLALSNQSSLLLNRTSRAAQRRSSSLPQRQDTSSSSGVDREKRPTNLSAPERLSISSLPKHHGDRPISVTSVEPVEEEEQADDEQDEEEQEIVDESPSFEALQPYPRDVSTEPSPDPTRQGFIPLPPAPPAQQLHKPHARNDSTRHIDHELVIDELEERLGVEPTRRRRARSNAAPNPSPSANSPNRSTSQPTGKKADTAWERKPPIQMPKSNVNMGAARDMLSAMFAKREQELEEKIDEQSSDEQSPLPVDWDVGSMAGLDEEDRPGKQEVPAPPEPTVVRRESTSVRRESVGVRRKSTVSQLRASIPISQHTPPIPASRPVPQPEAHPQTPSTASTIPETPNTHLSQSTQPTPPSDHDFEETDTEDEHPEDLADLIEAEPVVLSTPRSVVLRREVGRETSLPSRTGTGTGTPLVWTPRPGSGAWTPRHGSVVGGSGGLQVIESPTFERRRPERRQSAERSQPTLSERRQSTSARRIGDITQSTISDATLDTVSGQTESMSPVSRPLVSDRALVLAPVPPSGNGLGLSLGSVPDSGSAPVLSPVAPSNPVSSATSSGLGSSNGLGLDVLAPDIVSTLPSVSMPSHSAPPAGNVLGLGTGLDSGTVSPALPVSSSALVDSGSSTVGLEQVPQAAPVAPISPPPVVLGSILPPVGPTSELPVAPAPVSIPPATPPAPGLPRPAPPVEPNLGPSVTPSSSPSSSRPVVPPAEPSPVHPIMPESAPQAMSDPAPRTEPDLPVPRANPVVLQRNADSVPSIESSPLSPPSSETNLAARFSPSLVAGPDLKDDLPTLDRDPASIPIHSSESSGVLAESIRALPRVDGIHLDSESAVSRSSHDTVELHVPEQDHSFGEEREDSQQLTEVLPVNVVQRSEGTVQEDEMNAVKGADSVVVNGKDRVEAASMSPFNERSAANIEESHEEVWRAVQHDVGVHQEPVAERSQVISAGVHRDSAMGSKEDSRGEDQGAHPEPLGDVSADIGGEVMVEPTIGSGDSGAWALVSDSEVKLPEDAILGPTGPSSSGPVPALSNPGTHPQISEDPVAGKLVEKVAQNTHGADEVEVTQAKIPSNKQVSLGEASQDNTHEQARALQAVSFVQVEQVGADLDDQEIQGDRGVNKKAEVDDLPGAPIQTGATVEGVKAGNIMGQEVPRSGSRDENAAPAAQELATGASLGDSGPMAEQIASDNDLEERATSKTSTTGNPATRSEPSSPALVAEPASTSSPLPSPVLLPSAPINDEAALEPDHVDSLSELEESFGVRSPITEEPLPKSPQPDVPSSTPAISVPAAALVRSAPAVPERSPMIPPLSPLAPLSPILPSSPSVSSVSPSPPEPLSPPTPSSPPTTSSFPGSPSPAASSAPPISPAPELQQSGSQLIPSLAKAPSEDGQVIEHEPPAPGSALSRPAALESEPTLSPKPCSKVESSVQEGSQVIQETFVLPSHSPPPQVIEHESPAPVNALSRPEALEFEPILSPKPCSNGESSVQEGSPVIQEAFTLSSHSLPPPEPESLPSPSPAALIRVPEPDTPEQIKPDASPLRTPGSEIIPAPKLEPISSGEPPSSPSRPQSSKSTFPSSANSVADPSSSLERSPLSQSIVVDEPTPPLATPPSTGPPVLQASSSLLPEPESSFAEPAASPPGHSYSDLSPPEPSVLDPHPLSEPTFRSDLHASPEAPLPKTISPELSEPAVLPEPSELPQSIPVPNSSIGPNACVPDVSLPLEPSSSPRLSPLSKPPPPGPAELSEPSPLLNPSNLHDSSPLISPSLFEPSPWAGLSVMPKPSSPSSLPAPSSPEPPSGHPYLPGPSPSPSLGPFPDVLPVSEPFVEPELPPTEDSLGSERPAEPESSEVERLGDSQGPQGLQGTPDPLSPWGSLRLRRSPDVQRTFDDELPNSSLLFDYAYPPADSPAGSRTPLSRPPMLPEHSPLLEYAPPLEDVRSGECAERSEGDGLPESGIQLWSSVEAPFTVPPQHSGEPPSPSPVRESQLSQRSSLSEIPSLSDFAPPSPRSDPASQHVRTATLASESQAASEPSSKPRPRSELKPLRLSLLHGLGTLSPSAMITPVSANTVTPSPGLRSDAATPTPTAMYPTPSSAHPTQPSANLRSAPQSPPTSDETTEANAMPDSVHEPSGLNSVSWFGSKKGVKRGTLSAARKLVRRSIQGSNRSSLYDTTIPSPERGPAPATMEHSSPQSPTAAASDEDVRPLPMIWDDETEAGSKAGSSRQATQSPTHNQSHAVPVLEPFPPDTRPVGVAPPPVTPGRVDTVPRYPAFVNIGTSSPPISEGRSPLPSPPAASEPPSVEQSESEPVDPRSRKWADTVDQESIGSLPDFSAPAPSTQMLDGQPPESKEPHTPSKPKDCRHYMKIPNTAPLSISPRRVSPSIMQRAQDEGSGSYEQDTSSQDGMQSHAVSHTAPLDLYLRMPEKEGSNGPWMTEYFTKSPSTFHGSQFGSMHSASSSLSTGAKAVVNRQSVSSNKPVNRPVHVEDEIFGNPGPGPSTMKTYSERRQSAEILGSPIALQSSSRERAPSVPKTPQQHVPPETARRTSSQFSSRSMDATPRKAQDALQFKVSSAEPMAEAEMGMNPGIPSAATQHPIQNLSSEVSPTEQRTPYKALSLSSPSPGRQPPTPLTAPSPLQILRRNLMARTSPESPRFLSPQTRFTNLPETRPFRHQHHASASLAPTTHMRDEFRNVPMSAPGPRDRRSLTPNIRFAATPSIPGSPAQSVHSTISQTKPLLFFAIAKNSAQEVERLLQDGEVKPNDKAGPEDLPALAFALANEQLSDKTQIVKSLLSHGADPSSVLQHKTGSGQFDDADLALTTRIEQGMNPAIRYYLNRKQMTIPAPQAELLEKNNFGGLTRAGFSIIGQDAALEELIRVVAGHCRRQALNPLVVVFSGGPGCGKSLLASKIGPLLHVPYFTVNMTNLRNEAALFNYISMTAKVGQPQACIQYSPAYSLLIGLQIPLMDFLRNNQGQRCVVVLEEIEKAADKTVWHSLLMPWEWGKATIISPTTNEQIDIDTSQVIWIATSNSGDDATLKFFAERSRPSERGESALVRLAHNPRPKEDNFTRKDYLQLMQAVRKRLGELLGSSMISRVSSVLPFLPFTEDEVYALASESLSALRAEQKGEQSYEDVDWEELLQRTVGEYIPGEGARSVHRAVQRAFDEIAEW
ncbi:unnamed protein product [Rhizoctonia solani]|uniref:C3H1-type domain-containing protein n=1 Tax=Rhizoctonia solani TaxID=456999 RepID=A0A8H3DHS5_9AGAM|nr:unnamed protein product [Rhizoctonia solani]